MGSVFKKTTTAWTCGGKRVSPDTPGAEKAVIRSAKWYGAVDGRHVPLCRDKQAAERMLRKLEADRGLASVGLGDPFATHRRRPLADHLDDFAAHLRAKADTEDHVRLSVARVRAIFDGCGFRVAGDVDSARVAEWLGRLRNPNRQAFPIPYGESFTPGEVATLLGVSGAALRAAVKRHGLPATGQGKARRFPRATFEALAAKSAGGAGPQTVNHYVRAVRGFFRWMVRAKRIAANPVDTLSLVNAATDIRRARRELTADELRTLLAATRNSSASFRGLSAEDRYHLYLTAATTGFRVRALANLTPADFALATDPPTVTLPARFNKSRTPKVQPLPVGTASALKEYLEGKPSDRPVWAGTGTWAKDKKAAEMLRKDLVAAGIAYAVPGPDGVLYADFHSLRHTYLTLGGRSGIDLRTLQELAGHSKPELTARYSHRRLNDLADAIGKFPNVTSGLKPCDSVCTQFARTPCPSGHSPSIAGQKRGCDPLTPETTQPPVSQGVGHDPTPPVIGGHQRGRRDSNPQPPDRQSGALTN